MCSPLRFAFLLSSHFFLLVFSYFLEVFRLLLEEDNGLLRNRLQDWVGVNTRTAHIILYNVCKKEEAEEEPEEQK